MEKKIFKKREDLKTFIEQQDEPHFYIIKEEIKTFLKKQVIALIYNMSDVKTYLVGVLQGLLTDLDFNDIEIKISQINYETIKVNINCDNNALLIGKNGYVLSSLQNLSNCYLSSKFHRRYIVKVDVNDYFQRQESNLINLAKNTAKKVLFTKNDMALLPMPNNQRRIIHNELKKFDKVISESQGSGDKRHIVIKYLESSEI